MLQFLVSFWKKIICLKNLKNAQQAVGKAHELCCASQVEKSNEVSLAIVWIDFEFFGNMWKLAIQNPKWPGQILILLRKMSFGRMQCRFRVLHSSWNSQGRCLLQCLNFSPPVKWTHRPATWNSWEISCALSFSCSPAAFFAFPCCNSTRVFSISMQRRTSGSRLSLLAGA